MSSNFDILLTVIEAKNSFLPILPSSGKNKNKSATLSILHTTAIAHSVLFQLCNFGTLCIWFIHADFVTFKKFNMTFISLNWCLTRANNFEIRDNKRNDLIPKFNFLTSTTEND